MVTGEKTFLAIGECMVEMAPATGGLFRMGFAGDTFNTAWYARRLLPEAWRVGYASAVGEDSVSDELCAFLAGEGIATDTIRRVPDRTVGLYMIRVEDGERSFLYWRGQSAARAMADDLQWLARIAAARGVLYFSGITLAILAPDARERLCAALAKARAGGAHVAFDTNLRPRLWGDREAMRAGLLQGASVADTVLPSFDEESWLFGDASPSETVARYRGCGASLVAVKNGAGACTLWSTAGGEASVPGVAAARIVDTTAAGDSFGAGLLAGLHAGKPVRAAAEGAMRLASRVIGEPGALARGIFERDDTA